MRYQQPIVSEEQNLGIYPVATRGVDVRALKTMAEPDVFCSHRIIRSEWLIAKSMQAVERSDQTINRLAEVLVTALQKSPKAIATRSC